MAKRIVLRSLAGLLALLAAAPALAQTASRRPDGLIDIKAQQVPAGRMLRELAGLLPVTKLMIDPAAEAKSVALPEASGLSPADALEAVLSASKLPYIVWGGTKGPWRIVLGDEASAIEVKADPVASASTDDAGSKDEPASSTSGGSPFAARESSGADDARSAEPQSRVVTDDPNVPGGYTQTDENVTYHDPNFVPYKNRPEVRARRQKIDVTTIP